MPERKAYFAFIGHSHLDLSVAEELQHYIEHYKIPRRLRDQVPGLPDKLSPVFLAKNDLPLNEIRPELEKAVSVSKFYVIICSKNSAKPKENGEHIINDGLRHFLKLASGNKDRIIPIILREPPAEGSDERPEELMPPAIRGYLGADIGLLGKERAFSDVVAKMLGVSPDMLWRRHERELQARRRNKRIAGAAAGVCAAVGAWFAYDYFGEHTYYYADYTERNNVPVGVGELSKSQTDKRLYHYRFTVCKHMVTKVERCNSAGTPYAAEEPWHVLERDRPCSSTYEYNDKGVVKEVTQHDVNGVARSVLSFGGTGADGRWSSVTFRPVNAEGTVNMFAHHTSSTNMHWNRAGLETDNITWHKLVYDDDGYIERRLFMGDFPNNKIPIPDVRGVCGEQYIRDAEGRITSVTYLNKEGRPTTDKSGVKGFNVTYDSASRLVTNVETINSAGNKTLNEGGWAQVSVKYNDLGNPVRCEFRDAAGKPCMTNEGIWGVESTYDDKGNDILSICLDEAGSPLVLPGIATQVAVKYDPRGLVLERKFMDGVGNAAPSPEGYSTIRYEYDGNGKEISATCYDEHNQMCYNTDNYAKVVHEYGPNGNVASESFFGPDGNACLCRDGYAKMSLVYNEQGTEIGRAFYDGKGNPKECNDGYAKLDITYGGNCESLTLTYYNAKSEKCRIKGGYASVYVEIGKSGKITLVEYRDENGNPVKINGGGTRTTVDYDDKGNITELHSYDAQTQLEIPQKESADTIRVTDNDVPDAKGVLKVDVVLDENGKIAERIRHGKPGVPLMGNAGVTKITSRYAGGHIVEEEFRGEDGNLALGKDGYAIIRCKRDAYGNQLESSVYGINEEPVLNGSGYFRQTSVFDGNGNEIESRYFGTDGKPCCIADGGQVACIIRKFNDKGGQTEETYLNENGKSSYRADGVSKCVISYDAEGKEQKRYYYAPDGTLLFTK